MTSADQMSPGPQSGHEVLGGLGGKGGVEALDDEVIDAQRRPGAQPARAGRTGGRRRAPQDGSPDAAGR